MQPYTNNGSIIGQTMDFGSTDRYLIGYNTNYETLTYVGGRIQTSSGTTSDIAVSLSGLTGGTDSSPQPGDFVIIVLGIATTDPTGTISYRISGYSALVSRYADDEHDTVLQVGYKFMSVLPDTSVTITGGSASFNNGIAIGVHVWRNVDTSSPFDATTTSSTVINTAIPNPPAITTKTPGAQVILAAASASGTSPTYTAPYLSNFLTGVGNDVYDATVGIGSVLMPTPGSYNGAAWALTASDYTSNSNVSVAMALRPRTNAPIYGNYKNSGIWDMRSSIENQPVGKLDKIFGLQDVYEFLNSIVAASGGSVTSINGYKVHTFTSSGTLQITHGGEVEVLLVGGGGGGGGVAYGGGGGAGGVLNTFASVAPGSYNVIVGNGGAGGQNIDDLVLKKGTNGGNSSLFELVAVGGGGGGGGGSTNTSDGNDGGSGGGGGGSTVQRIGGIGVSGQGFSGGINSYSSTVTESRRGGGGGGASAKGGNATTTDAGDGGNGRPISITGTTVYYGGGGGGGARTTGTAGTGGIGGGGGGGIGTGVNGVSGTANTGGGGGGAGTVAAGGAGGSGIVIIRYRVRL